MISEAAIIAKLHSAFPQYIGDDAAVIEKCGTESYVISKDMLIEDIHFRTAYYDPHSLGYKAVQVTLSDIAAMGATPQFILLGIAIPTYHAEYTEAFLRHFTEACREAAVILIGGDTTKSPDKLYISVTTIGSAPTAHIKYRSTAQPGDIVCLAGELGHAHLGLQACEQGWPALDVYKNAFLRPIAKVAEGRWLAKQSAVTAMMDVSDGLFIDLSRLAAASRVAGNIALEQLAPHPALTTICATLKLDPITVMLTGGEDYGLLFTVAPSGYPELAATFAKEFGYNLKQVGNIAHGTGVTCTKNGEPQSMHLRPFSHFGEL